MLTCLDYFRRHVLLFFQTILWTQPRRILNKICKVRLDPPESERRDGSGCSCGRSGLSRLPHGEEHSQPRRQGDGWSDVDGDDNQQVADLVILGVEEAIIERNSKMHSTDSKRQHEIAKWVLAWNRPSHICAISIIQLFDKELNLFRQD